MWTYQRVKKRKNNEPKILSISNLETFKQSKTWMNYSDLCFCLEVNSTHFNYQSSTVLLNSYSPKYSL